ncbi:5-aminopentanamidase [Nocardioides albertanoniae]|uniref:5-aminopentanamidase n=1 Tax=Nocardioides albertanoniae TaxID=1175486 RepID=A0A543AE25_9ACTN|nr:carbon-nitrogen hydrolase family protein [Nocardioides albertanoniae]TQL70838.1 5-aminopentanamidase [Nocardioides albertanoniae]
MSTTSPDPLRIAAWQCAPDQLDVERNLARLDDVCGRAAEAGAAVLVAPEMVTTGYAIGPEQVHRLAEPADGATYAEVARIAQRHRIAIAYGFPELAGEKVYNSAALVAPDGTLCGVHRKTHLWGGTDAAQFDAIDVAPEPVELDGDPVGMLICYDVEFPEPVRRLAVAGSRLLLVPTANPVGSEHVPEVLVPARALESRIAVVYANQCGSDALHTYGGRSVICSRTGQVLAAAGTEEELLVADVDLDEVLADDHLADRRPELYL